LTSIEREPAAAWRLEGPPTPVNAPVRRQGRALGSSAEHGKDLGPVLWQLTPPERRLALPGADYPEQVKWAEDLAKIPGPPRTHQLAFVDTTE
jgi:hypothetical protein